MRIRRVTCRMLIVVTACTSVVAPSVNAEIAKCVDAGGRISYSDQFCVNAIVIGYLDGAPVPVVTATKSRPVTTPGDMPGDIIEAQSRWAHQALRSRYSLDTATVGQAREALATSDRAQSLIRRQNLALNR